MQDHSGLSIGEPSENTPEAAGGSPEDQVSALLMPQGPPTSNEGMAQFIDLYKLMVQSSEALMSRRLGTNTFFLTVNGLLLTAIALFVRQGADTRSHGAAISILCVAGFVIAGAWRTLVSSFGQLNKGKFAVILRMEKALPAAIFEAEWEALGRGADKTRYKSFTSGERRIPIVFMTIYGIAFMASLLLVLDRLPMA